MIFEVEFLEEPTTEKVTLQISCAPSRSRIGSQVYTISGCQGEATYIRPATAIQIETAKQVGAATAVGTSWAGGHTVGGAAILTSLIALDPTGTFFRFTKILQIVNKLYFININYGKRLEAFLWQIKSTPPNKDPPNAKVTMSGQWRGKLSSKNEPLSMSDSVNVQIWLYLASWLALFFRWCAKRFMHLPRSLLIASYYFDHVHLIIFNLVFIDFIWLAPRTLMHLFRVTNFESEIPLQVFLKSEYQRVMELPDDPNNIEEPNNSHTSSLVTTMKQSNKSEKMTKKEKLNEIEEMADGAEYYKQGKVFYVRAPVPPQTKQINYKKTYFEIELNRPLFFELTPWIRLESPVFNSLACRILAFMPWIRVSVYELIIVTCQPNPTFGLLLLITFELAHLTAVIYAYLKYKYLKNIICLLMELSSGVFLLAFSFNALFISPKRFDEIIMDFYQDAGIWIVIASCVAEYLLLITYIAVAAYEFFKNRKMMKKMNARPYDEDIIKYTIEGDDISMKEYITEYKLKPTKEEIGQLPQGDDFHQPNGERRVFEEIDNGPDKDLEIMSRAIESMIAPEILMGQAADVANQFSEIQIRNKPLAPQDENELRPSLLDIDMQSLSKYSSIAGPENPPLPDNSQLSQPIYGSIQTNNSSN
jgi:hypothetical protein